jgi:hypothetical protein
MALDAAKFSLQILFMPLQNLFVILQHGCSLCRKFRQLPDHLLLFHPRSLFNLS